MLRKFCALVLTGWLITACAPANPLDPLPTLIQPLATLTPAPTSPAPALTIAPSPSPTSTSLPPTATPAPPAPIAADVRAMQLVARQTGWALTDQGLWWTTDGGAHWADITPPDMASIAGSAVAPIADVVFITAERGWVIAVQPSPNASEKALLTSWRTFDGGQTWQASPVTTLESAPEVVFGGGLRAEVSFADEQTGSVLVMLIPTRNTRQASWCQTRDGGWTWAQRFVPMGGHLHFVGQSTGWLLGGETQWVNDQFFVTRDGGFTWKLEPVRLPMAYGEYVRPELTHPDTSVVVVRLSEGQGLPATTLGFLTSTSLWETWSVTAAFSDPTLENLGMGVRVPVAVIDDEQWIVALPAAPWAVTQDGGQTWQRFTPASLTADQINRLSFVTSREGWALTQFHNGPGQLWATVDGGRTWRAILD